MEQQNVQLFAATLDSLKGRHATIAALIDFADGNVFALWQEAWIWGALESRNIVKWNIRQWNDDDKLGLPHTVPMYDLTDYGRAFVAWYRQPKDFPAQMDMFDALDSD